MYSRLVSIGEYITSTGVASRSSEELVGSLDILTEYMVVRSVPSMRHCGVSLRK